MTNRQTPRLSAQQVASYVKDGFLGIPNALTPDRVNELRNECRRLWSDIDLDKSNPRLQWRRKLDGAEVADRIDPLADLSTLIEDLTQDIVITQPVSELLETPAPELFKAKLISKWPGTAGYAMHQDYTYWVGLEGTAPDDFITVLLALDQFDESSGTLELFPGLHHSQLPGPADNPKDVDETRMDLSISSLAALEPGDLMLFHSQTPHRSGPNMSKNNRESLFFTYTREGMGHLGDRYYSVRPTNFMSAK